MEISKELVQRFLEKKQKISKHIRYEYQQWGLYLAHKLGEWQRRSFYIRIARDEPRALVQQAFTYAMYSPESKRAKTFLWRLKELKKKTYYRAFVAFFPDMDGNAEFYRVYESVQRAVAEVDRRACKVEDINKLHMTLYFWPRLQAVHYPRIVRLLRRFRTKYGDNVTLEFNSVNIWGEGRYLGLVQPNSMAYRMYAGLRKLSKERAPSLYDLFVGHRRFFPHITLVRGKAPDVGKCTEKLLGVLQDSLQGIFPIKVEGQVYLAISRLTSKGSKYTIHVDSKV